MDEITWNGKRWSDDNPVTDEEKHAFCKRRWGVCAVFLPPTLYAAAEQTGFDMRRFVIDKPIPLGASGGGTNSYMVVLKGPRRKCTFGIACMPGLNGKCTACSMNEG